MALPGLQYQGRDSGEKRAFASNVAQYYQNYVEKMNLSRYFKSGVIVTKVQYLEETQATACDKSNENTQIPDEARKWIKKIDDDISEWSSCTEPESNRNVETEPKNERTCSLSRALNFITLRSNRKLKTHRCCKRPRDDSAIRNDCSPDRKIREVMAKTASPGSRNYGTVYSFLGADSGRSVNGSLKSFSCNFRVFRNSCERLCSGSRGDPDPLRNTQSLDFESTQVPNDTETECRTKSQSNLNKADNAHPKWSVEVYDVETKTCTTYLCKYLVLANGASDLPNRLAISADKNDPSWLLHDVRSLEIELDQYVQNRESNYPVVVVGAGLSAADAIIAARGRNVPVIHIFRNKNAAINKQLPENMYPEYHKVRKGEVVYNYCSN